MPPRAGGHRGRQEGPGVDGSPPHLAPMYLAPMHLAPMRRVPADGALDGDPDTGADRLDAAALTSRRDLRGQAPTGPRRDEGLTCDVADQALVNGWS